MRPQKVSRNTKIAEWNSKMAYEYQVLQEKHDSLKGWLWVVGAVAMAVGVVVGRFVL